MKGTLLFAALISTIFAAPAIAEDTITIGMTVSRTGSLNVDSVSQLRGAELWRDEVNAKGGIAAGGKHYQVRFVEYDDQSQGGRVQQLYTRLILEDKSQFLLGPYSSGLTATAAVITEQYGTIMTGRGRRRGEDLRARQQIPVPSPHCGRSIPERRDRGAEGA